MTVSEWEKHTLLADSAMRNSDHQRSILHYQKALAMSEQLTDSREITLEDKLIISVISCHNLAAFWRHVGNSDYELKYLELASERILTLVPQCQRKECHAFIDSLGCCKKAFIEFLKRHPDPRIAHRVKDLDSMSNCNLIATFKLH
ncbi:hypothetical protein VA7868_04039 [Vibrio aerogenes CECT 7868]|uniref:DUF2753 domain-containing protein n=1 Tax=Vibrio aerogenes CECT 7868 TaxID=1216006 RepID=A0A1M6CLI3_9VIBR|nr:DUF2753 family protein [Vibrio aerogenes]SHI61568.1 hypothetical protein VA7868_04039 [Vibrio aerogenes CECT 7868]